jgi:NAD(P)-dependent dehydrogenase (short-subunit alcohol dehydrogenase family)
VSAASQVIANIDSSSCIVGNDLPVRKPSRYVYRSCAGKCPRLKIWISTLAGTTKSEISALSPSPLLFRCRQTLPTGRLNRYETDSMQPINSSSDRFQFRSMAGTMTSGSRTVLITGGTSGIGAAIARVFAAAGDRVTACGATDAEVAAASRQPEMSGITFRRLDVRDNSAVMDLVAGQGELDVVVNCAGVIRRDAEHSPEVFAEVLDINLTGTMRVCTAARPALRQRQGSIINIASMLTFFGGGLVPGYSASKGGIAQLTKSLAIAYAADQVRVNAVAPGWIATALTQALQDNPDRSDQILARTPLRRWGTPEDVAGPVLFLASPAARFITGVVLPVDGGYLIC